MGVDPLHTFGKTEHRVAQPIVTSECYRNNKGKNCPPIL